MADLFITGTGQTAVSSSHAILLCDEHSIEVSSSSVETTYDDWYLPSEAEYEEFYNISNWAFEDDFYYTNNGSIFHKESETGTIISVEEYNNNYSQYPVRYFCIRESTNRTKYYGE